MIGTDDPEPDWQMLSRLFTFTVSPSGWIYFNQGGAGGPFHIVDESGDLQGSFGGTGRGPGEYRYPGPFLWLDGGSELWILDSTNRIGRHTPMGSLIETTTFGRDGRHSPQRYLGNGHFLGFRKVGPFDDQVDIWMLLDEDLQTLRDVASVPYRPFVRISAMGAVPLPFTGWSDLVVQEGRGFVTVLPNQGKLVQYDLEGDPIRSITRDWERTEVTAQEQEEWIESLSSKEGVEISRIRSAELPTHHPPFTAAETDEEGRIWVKRYGYLEDVETEGEGIASVWDVFDVDGVWLGHAVLPAMPWIIRGEHLYHRFAGDADTGPRIERYRIVPLVDGF